MIPLIVYHTWKFLSLVVKVNFVLQYFEEPYKDTYSDLDSLAVKALNEKILFNVSNIYKLKIMCICMENLNFLSLKFKLKMIIRNNVFPLPCAIPNSVAIYDASS